MLPLSPRICITTSSQWKESQDNLKFTLQRQLYGVHMPVRQLMERSIVGQVRAEERASERALCVR